MARPTRWRNPYRVRAVRTDRVRYVVETHPRDCAEGLPGWLTGCGDDLARAHEVAVEWHLWALEKGWLTVTIADVVAELRGRDLACWCHEDLPCHAGTYLDLANP